MLVGIERFPFVKKATLFDISRISSKSWLIKIIAAPVFAISTIACLIFAAERASTPHVGWFTMNKEGFCPISLPTTNFWRLPPDSDEASALTPVVFTLNFSII